MDGWWGKSDRRVSADETKKTRRERERETERKSGGTRVREIERGEKKTGFLCLLF